MGVLVAGPLFLGLAPAQLPDPGGFTADELKRSVSKLEPRTSSLDPRIQPAASQRDQGSDTVVTLETDILFAFGKASISDSARARIRELVVTVPRGVTVYVGGHTDSIGRSGSNRRLSAERAETVASVIRAARSDLRLRVQGYGETRPVTPNTARGEDNPEGRAKNRRVELRYRR